MSAAKLGLHRVKAIEIEENEDSQGARWRHVNFLLDDGNQFVVTAFAADEIPEGVPVTFVRDLDGESS
jgi:hypothetical protein